ncbi:peroxiredoxin [Lysobacteraceae bacterium NML08-0793]|nr:peroxiredoxin [Xanthomonadaceae bacterium NML08-0793]
MHIQVGDRIPQATLQCVHKDGFEKIDSSRLFQNRRVLLFAVPGAFTPTCSEQHLPGYVAAFDAFASRGVDVICLSVNDPFVMQAWGAAAGIPEGLRMLADGNAEFTQALGLAMDGSAYGMGLRSKRYALYAEDGVVKDLQVEAPGEFRVSAAEYMLKRLP